MKIRTMICALTLVLSSAAFAQKVSVEYGHQVDFSKLKTYRWGKNKGQLPGALENDHIKHKLDRVLQAKGLRRANAGSADMVVTYQATEREQQEVDTYADDMGMGLGMGGGWGWGPGWGPGWGAMAPMTYPTTQSITYVHKGDLLVDIANPATKNIIYRGYATGAFHSNPIKEDKLMSKAIKKMFKNFPPKQK